MKHIGKTESKELTIYHYSFSDLRKFIEHGRAEGNNGVILTKDDNGMRTYRGYGTIEKPCKELITITMKHLPAFDDLGPSKPPEYRFVILDFGKK